MPAARRRPLLPPLPQRGNFKEQKLEFLKKNVLAVVYYSMSFERLYTGGDMYVYQRHFLEIFLVRLDMPCQQNVTSHTNV